MLNASTRGNSLPPSAIRKLTPYAEQAKKDGKRIYHLNIGQPDIETPKPMRDILRNFTNEVISYGPSQGLPEYVSALIQYYKKHCIELIEENIIVTTGGSEAILIGFLVCLDKGDEILIPEPFYANYNSFAVSAGVTIKPITTYLESDWELPSIEEIESTITDNTKAILICNPNNPTGKVYDQKELTKIATLAKKHNLFIFGDEVYREFIYSDEKHVGLLDLKGMEEHVVVMDSISKRFNSCGARVGAFVSKNKKIMAAALAFAQARLCPPTIAQMMAIPSVTLDENYFPQVIREYKERRDLILTALSEMEGVKYRVPRGAFYITVKLPVENSEDFVIWLLTSFDINNETVMLAPAEGFYKTEGLGKDEVRIAFVLNKEKTQKAMNIIKEGLIKYNAR